jgi:hypothetical protein
MNRGQKDQGGVDEYVGRTGLTNASFFGLCFWMECWCAKGVLDPSRVSQAFSANLGCEQIRWGEILAYAFVEASLTQWSHGTPARGT